MQRRACSEWFVTRIAGQSSNWFSGASGSGKSTAIDILLGLIEPNQGCLGVDDKPITAENVRAWQNNIGFVPQSIFLSDATIRENIAFGLPLDEIDDKKVLQAAQMAHLEELISQLPNGLDTRVGERGVQLSGGQRQRIGIARALYDDVDVLVLDEATSGWMVSPKNWLWMPFMILLVIKLSL